MKVLYGYSNCDDKTFNRIMQGKNIVANQASQKYHSLLIKGLSKNDIIINCISGLPMSRAISSQKYIHIADLFENNVYYHYVNTLNFPGIRHLMIFFGTVLFCIKNGKGKEVFALCDALNLSNAFGMRLGCWLKKIPIVYIVTDIPDMFESKGLLTKLRNSVLKKADGFIFLTKQMNNRINGNNKPFVVIEGHVDSSMQNKILPPKIEELTGKKVVVYAGTIQKKYGVKNLTEGFLKANIPDAELHIFGDGDYRDELQELAASSENIKYFGVVNNATVVQEEMKASILVNPRPEKNEYTKYSFPSKNLEYMVSGTPVLATKLSGIPDEYHKYMYLIEDDSVDGIAAALRHVLSVDHDIRKNFGLSARKYVLEEKNEISQANKIIKFLTQISDKEFLQ